MFRVTSDCDDRCVQKSGHVLLSFLFFFMLAYENGSIFLNICDEDHNFTLKIIDSRFGS